MQFLVDNDRIHVKNMQTSFNLTVPQTYTEEAYMENNTTTSSIFEIIQQNNLQG